MNISILTKCCLMSCIILVGCNKGYNTEFIISNDSQRKISIFLTRLNNDQVDTNIINSGKELIFLVESGDGKTTNDYMNGLNELPVDSLKIIDLAGNGLLCHEKDLICWRKFIPDKKDGLGSFTLRIRENSFEQ